MSLGRLPSPFFGRSAQTAAGKDTDLLGMDLLLVLDETAGRGRSRRCRRGHGAGIERLGGDPAGGDDLPSGASRGLVSGLPISFLLWAVIGGGVWAMWLR
jgi:hypothetical protein